MSKITIAPLNEAYCYAFPSDEGTERDLSQEFSYEIPGARYMKQGWRKNWDGRVRIYNKVNSLIPKGLVPRVIKWAHDNGVEVVNNLQPTESAWEPFDLESLLKRYPTPDGLEIRDYQRNAINWALRKQRCVLISPTGSGKSLILYYLVRQRLSEGSNVLLIVPTISLVSQMVSDWKNYGWTAADKYVHKITGGVDKDTHKPVVVSTWQSIYKQDPEWFERYKTLLCDEAHTAKAESLKGIGDKMVDCEFRVGVTGTLDDTKSHRLVVEGVFGKGYKVAKTAELQTAGHLSPIRIQAHYLQYSKSNRWLIEQQIRDYQKELDFIVAHPERMKWLVDFIGQLQGNVLVLFQYIEKHGEPLYKALVEAHGKTRPIHYVVGKVSGEDREDIRHMVENQTNAIIAASYGTFSQGVDMKKLHFVVFASPSKSRYRVLQSIGRGLRLHSTKKEVYVMDIIDDAHSPKYNNYAYRHWKKRAKFYEEEQFPVEHFAHELNGS